jgi:OmpA-OmpF porin, OOP family
METASFIQATAKWWRGLIPLAALCLFTDHMLTERIEGDLSYRAAATDPATNPGAEPSTWASIHVEGRDAVVTGTAPTADVLTHITEAAGNAWGVRLVANNAIELPPVRPFQWSALRDATHVTLSGYIPPLEARAKVLQQAKTFFPGVKISDTMQDANGEPENFAAMTTFALSKLAVLTTGNVELLDNGFSIKGAAPSKDVYDAITTATHSLPAQMTLRNFAVSAPALPPPLETSSISNNHAPSSYVWFARHDGRQVILSGSVPDENARDALLAAARRSFGSTPVNDKTQKRSDGAPAGFAAAAEVGLVQLAKLETGAAAITDADLTLIGLAPSEDIASEANSAVAKVTGTIAGSSTVIGRPKALQAAATAATPAAADQTCTAGLKEASNQKRIQFESLKSVILPQSMPVIDGIASLLKKCPGLKIEISGHTDNTGRASFNKSLSLLRASAVSAALTKAGIDRSRLRMAGHGAEKPVASNASQTGRASNRRIEFNVLR